MLPVMLDGIQIQTSHLLLDSIQYSSDFLVRRSGGQRKMGEGQGQLQNLPIKKVNAFQADKCHSLPSGHVTRNRGSCKNEGR